MTANLAASIRARLLALAKQHGYDYNLVLNRFGLERLLYRLSTSAYADRFLLKGAMLFSLWYDDPYRPTRDADLLGFGQDDIAHLIAVFQEIAAIDTGDGVQFAPDSVQAQTIREDSTYGGTRITLTGTIGSARCPIQIDIGFGDAVTPGPETVTFPALLGGIPAPTLRVYPVYTVIAEKYQAMVMLGLANSRMKDFYDLYVIAHRTALEATTLAGAIAATFARRDTAIPTQLPLPLTPEFAKAPAKQQQWTAFLTRNRLKKTTLEEAISRLRLLLWLPTELAVSGAPSPARWQPDRCAWERT